MKKAVEFPMAFLIFLIIALVLFALLLMWNLSGAKTFENITSNASCNIVRNASGGVINTIC